MKISAEKWKVLVENRKKKKKDQIEVLELKNICLKLKIHLMYLTGE